MGDAVTVTVGQYIDIDRTYRIRRALKALRQADTLNGFDFGNIWRVTDEYPTLMISYRAQRRAAGLWDGSEADAYNGGKRY